jgi:hypothetical protein
MKVVFNNNYIIYCNFFKNLGIYCDSYQLIKFVMVHCKAQMFWLFLFLFFFFAMNHLVGLSPKKYEIFPLPQLKIIFFPLFYMYA